MSVSWGLVKNKSDDGRRDGLTGSSWPLVSTGPSKALGSALPVISWAYIYQICKGSLNLSTSSPLSTHPLVSGDVEDGVSFSDTLSLSLVSAAVGFQDSDRVEVSEAPGVQM